MDTVVQLNDVSMRFNMTKERTDSLKDYFIKLVKGKLIFDEFYALKNISFSIEKGDSLGIVGPNGCGKSTLLKIVSGIFAPSSGTVRVEGQVAPLIELGAGFDPELTGRENVFLNGLVLGYPKNFIKSHFDEIIDFAEIEEFIDVPIKNYSSGMVARLGFSIATLVNPDILIVDEILGVGDAKFQKKCEKRMTSILSSGTTLLFVSHNIKQVEKLCNKALWLSHGECVDFGNIDVIAQKYEAQSNE